MQTELKYLQGQEQTKYMGTGRTDSIKGSINKLKQIETRTGKEYKEYIKEMGKSSYDLKRNIIYRETYLNELEKVCKIHEEFIPVYEHLKKITNPHDFYYNTIDEIESLKDFYTWYHSPESYAGFKTPKELADFIIDILENEKE